MSLHVVRAAQDGGNVSPANRTVVTCTRWTRFSQPTRPIGVESNHMPGTDPSEMGLTATPMSKTPSSQPPQNPAVGTAVQAWLFQRHRSFSGSPQGVSINTREWQRGWTERTELSRHRAHSSPKQHLGCGWRYNPKSQVQLDGGKQTRTPDSRVGRTSLGYRPREALRGSEGRQSRRQRWCSSD